MTIICDQCNEREARVRLETNGALKNLCPLCFEGRRASFGGSSPFDALFSSFFGGGGFPAARPSAVQSPDITQLFSDRTKELIQRSVRFAVDRGSQELRSEHLLAAALEDEVVAHVISAAGGDAASVRAQLIEELPGGERLDLAPEMAPEAKRALFRAYQEAREVGATYIGPEHLLLALAADTETRAGELLTRFALAHTKLRQEVVRSVDRVGGAKERSTTPTLDGFSRDLTAMAREGKLDPVIGRAEEIESAIEILSRRKKNNPVLIGDPGVGKTAIVEGIAQRIANDDVPETLAGQRVLALDLSGMVAGTKYRGEFEERLTKVVEEVTAEQANVILFIDEVHTVVGAGSAEGSMDAANILKPALARGELRVVAATTIDEYRKHIEKDAALERRFQPVLVAEPTVEETVQVLYGLKDRYEAFHKVRLSDEAIVGAAELSDRYISDRFLPDKAIDLIDQAGARVRLRSATKSSELREVEQERARLEREKDQAISSEDYELAAKLRQQLAELPEPISEEPVTPEVTLEEVASVLSRQTGIPVSQLTAEERSKLLALEERLHERVVGQKDAVQAVSEAVRRSRAGVGDPNRPIGSFLFLGPTGVGKTELARSLAEALFGDEELMIRLDMSEYQERHTVSRLVGAPPGYVGHDEAGQLTEAVRSKPYAVLLLDEVEKAHSDVFNILLQILDDGHLTDSKGRRVNFKNTVVIMTSNLAAEQIMRHHDVGFGSHGGSDDPLSSETIKERIMPELKKHFRPEFINRIDEIICFESFDREQMMEISKLLLDRVARRLHAQDLQVSFDDEAVSFLTDEGFDPQFGARPLRRTIQRLVENPLSNMILGGELSAGASVAVSVTDGLLDFKVSEPHVNDSAESREEALVG